VDGVSSSADARLQALLDAIPDLMLRLRADGTYLDCAGDVSLLVTSADELVGANAWELLPAEVAGELMGAVTRALECGTRQRAVYALATADGELRDFEARVVRSGDDEVVAIVRDVTELNRVVRQLRDSRRRIVEAADDERHRLERNLHDGAQQRLVALFHHLHLVDRSLEDDPVHARTLLHTGQAELAATLAEIRELVRGLHPSLLTRRGLGTALGALAGRLPMPVELAVVEERLAPEVEAAAYYVVAEALTNTAKHAGASRAAVAVTVLGDRLVVEVADDGCGGADPGASGLRGLADRVEAFGGSLLIESPADRGTRVRAEIPVD
jgi:PAS domain S-box-containing protein